MEPSVAVAQFGIEEDEGKYEAQERAMDYVKEAADDGADLVVLPEMSTQTFYPSVVESESDLPEDLEPIPGPAVDNFRDVAEQREVVIVYPQLEHAEEGDYYSSAAVLDADGSLAGVYRRLHRDTSADVHEDWLSTGDDIPVFETEVGTLGVMVGHDRHFPEESRILGLHGAEVICCPSAAWGDHYETWELELRAHTVAQGVFLAAANRTGQNGDLSFYGESFIIDPRGRVQGKLGEDPDYSVVECDYEEIREVRDVWQFYRDRRPETYEEMTQEVVPEGV
jgi:beta-ureidopropionase